MEQFVNRGSKRTQHQWSEASKYHPDYLLKSNLAHHFVQRFWPSKGFTFLFGLYKWACPNVPCIWGSQKIKRAMLHVGRRGPIFCQIIFYCDFWSTRKLLYFPLFSSSVRPYVTGVIIHLPLSTFPPVILTTLPPISVNFPPYVWHFYPL